MEGEGSFGWNKGNNCPTIVCGQVDLEPLLRLQTVIGGNLYKRKVGARALPNAKPLHALQLNGVPAISVMMTLYSMMSSRRKARIEEILAKWKGTPVSSGVLVRNLGVCKNGHKFEGDNIIYAKSGKRRCRRCVNDWQNKRASQNRLQPFTQ
jgi:hypothetical protein